MITSDLIRSLAEDAKPVRRLRPPLLRAFGWLCVSGVILGALTMWHGVRPEFLDRMREVAYMVAMMSAMATGILAAVAAFMVGLPDRSPRWALLPLPSLIVWLGNLGYQCLAGWEPLPPGAVTAGAAASCLTTLIFTSLPLSLLLVGMLRHMVWFRPTGVIVLGSIAVSALTSASLAMFHPLDATAMIIGWNLGTVLIVFAVMGLASRIMRRRRVQD